MTMSNPTLTLAVFLALPLSTWAVPPPLSDFPPPRPPLVAPPAEQARWTISLQQVPPAEKGGEALPPRKSSGVQTIQSVKTGPIKQDLIVYESGGKSEIWYFQNHVLSANSTNPSRVIVQNLSALNDPMDSQGIFRELGHPVRSAGYPGFDWVDLRHYQGLTYFNKTLPTYHYALRGKDPETGAAIVAAEAWIHAGTGAPVAYRTGGNVYVYTFGDPPAETLTLPPNFAAAQTRLQRSLDRQRRLESDAAAQR